MQLVLAGLRLTGVRLQELPRFVGGAGINHVLV